MKALSIRQPWAFAIVHLGKDVENRTWRTDYRGPIAIHASKLRLRKNGEPTPEQRENVESAAIGMPRTIPIHDDVRMTWRDLIESSGAIVGTARIVDCVTESASPWFVGPYGIVIADVRPTPIVPCRGALGLWTVPPEVERQIREAV